MVNKLDRLEKMMIAGNHLLELGPLFPDGFTTDYDLSVRSRPLPIGKTGVELTMAGRLDALYWSTTCRKGLLDFKTSDPHEDTGSSYSPQLHGYTWALEKPAGGFASVERIDEMGLMTFFPVDGIIHLGRPLIGLEPQWIPVERNDRQFKALLTEIAEVLADPKPPAASPACEFCALIGGLA